MKITHKATGLVIETDELTGCKLYINTEVQGININGESDTFKKELYEYNANELKALAILSEFWELKPYAIDFTDDELKILLYSDTRYNTVELDAIRNKIYKSICDREMRKNR